MGWTRSPSGVLIPGRMAPRYKQRGMFAMGPGFFRQQASSLNYAAAVLADAPVGYWHLGETSGTTAADSSGNSHNATYAGTYTLGNSSLLPHGYGKSFNSAAAADIALPTGWISSVSSNISIEAWIKVASFSGGPNILSTYNGGFSLGITSGGNLELANPGVVLLAQDITLLATVTVYYVVATWDSSGNIKFYVNGALSSTSTGHGAANAGVDSAYIGAYQVTLNRFNGSLQEVALYNTALTATQIANHYAAA